MEYAKKRKSCSAITEKLKRVDGKKNQGVKMSARAIVNNRKMIVTDFPAKEFFFPAFMSEVMSNKSLVKYPNEAKPTMVVSDSNASQTKLLKCSWNHAEKRYTIPIISTALLRHQSLALKVFW